MEKLVPTAKTAQVNFECGWTGVLSSLQLGESFFVPGSIAFNKIASSCRGGYHCNGPSKLLRLIYLSQCLCAFQCACRPDLGLRSYTLVTLDLLVTGRANATQQCSFTSWSFLSPRSPIWNVTPEYGEQVFLASLGSRNVTSANSCSPL